MGKLSMDLYLDNLIKRYKSANRKQKSALLEELCAISGYHKKHAIRLLAYIGAKCRIYPDLC